QQSYIAPPPGDVSWGSSMPVSNRGDSVCEDICDAIVDCSKCEDRMCEDVCEDVEDYCLSVCSDYVGS
ncbi:MAG: hypothetical protein NZ912_03165, partial [Ignisphaera sp.]|nr:hypothetical protein [Ignisphaera sp.]